MNRSPEREMAMRQILSEYREACLAIARDIPEPQHRAPRYRFAADKAITRLYSVRPGRTIARRP